MLTSEMAQEEVQARLQATTPDSDYSERPAGDPDSRFSISNLISEDLRRFVVEERKSYKEELRRLRVQLDRSEEARARSEDARARSEDARARSEEALRARARCCTIM